VWNGNTYAWRPGYWARVQPGYVWVPDHYRWTPGGYLFIPGYWDLAISKRGLLYAPVVIRPEVVTVGFVYTPAYAVRDTVVVDAMFVRPTTCHYYFGDYYEVRYQSMGYQSTVVYSRTYYDPIVVYESRTSPTWINVQLNLYNNRVAGIDPRPPAAPITNTTIVQNNITNVNNITMIAPTTTVIQNKNMQVVNIDNSTRMQAVAQSKVVQQVALQRAVNEKPLPPGAPRVARKASLSVPKAQPVKPGMTVPKAPVVSARTSTSTRSETMNNQKKPVTTPPITPKQQPRTYTPVQGKQPPGRTPTGQQGSNPSNSRWLPAVPQRPGQGQPPSKGRPPAKDDKDKKDKR
jgi:hypothetical protein